MICHGAQHRHDGVVGVHLGLLKRENAQEVTTFVSHEKTTLLGRYDDEVSVSFQYSVTLSFYPLHVARSCR